MHHVPLLLETPAGFFLIYKSLLKLTQAMKFCEALLFDACSFRGNKASRHIDQDLIYLDCMHWALSMVLKNASVRNQNRCFLTMNLL